MSHVLTDLGVRGVTAFLVSSIEVLAGFTCVFPLRLTSRGKKLLGNDRT